MDRTNLSVLVALHSGSLSGIDSYAEQIAAAAAAAGHDVTLLGLGGATSRELERRLGHTRLRIVATPELSTDPWQRIVRRVPTAALSELRSLLAAALAGREKRFDVAHLNHPALARAVRPFSDRVVAGAWFYPHRPIGRVTETWRHTGRIFPKSAALAVKGLSHYLNDRTGYRSCDAVAAPTERLAAQLRAMSIDAVAFPPPAVPSRTDRAPAERRLPGTLRITICCGDLGHPRKNVRAGVKAAAFLANTGRVVELMLVGHNAGSLDADLASLPSTATVHRTGPLPRQAIESLMAGSDVLLVPSLYEEWGYVATEALMTGTPVAAFPVYPFDEVLEPPLGVCAHDMTSRSLARATALAADLGADRSAVKAAALDRYGPEAAGRRLSTLWSLPSTAPRAVAI